MTPQKRKWKNLGKKYSAQIVRNAHNQNLTLLFGAPYLSSIQHKKGGSNEFQTHCYNCSVRGQLLQVASQQTEVRIDNGITDINFTTAIVVRSRIDQNIFEDFNVIVQSLFSDAYDRESKNWGIYSVETVLSADRACK